MSILYTCGECKITPLTAGEWYYFAANMTSKSTWMCAKFGCDYVARLGFPWRLVLMAEDTFVDDNGAVHISESEEKVSACYIGELNEMEENCMQPIKALYHLNQLSAKGVAAAHDVMNATLDQHKDVIKREDARVASRLVKARFKIQTRQGTLPKRLAARAGHAVCQ